MLRNNRTFDEREEWDMVVNETINGEWGGKTICDFVTIDIEQDIINAVKNQVAEIIRGK